MLTRVATLVLVFGLTFAERAEAQTPKPTSEQKTSVATPQEPEDPLGRTTPRSAVMTFLRAIQKEDYERATEYLDSRLKLPERQELARKLGVIFDRTAGTDTDRQEFRPLFEKARTLLLSKP